MITNLRKDFSLVKNLVTFLPTKCYQNALQTVKTKIIKRT